MNEDNVVGAAVALMVAVILAAIVQVADYQGHARAYRELQVEANKAGVSKLAQYEMGLIAGTRE